MSMSNHDPLLQVNHLKTYFYTDEGVVRAVDNVSFSLDRGKSLGIVGESGSGKSVTAKSIIKLIPMPPGKIVDGEIILDGVDIRHVPHREMRHIRGEKVSMIFQEPMTSLNPVFTIGNQLAEAIKIHQKLSSQEIRAKSIEMLDLVRIPNPETRLKQYPHELSGGMRQRIMIAMALSCQPEILICDEPTTALDVTIQAQVLDLINDIQRETGTAIITITHDFGVISEVSDDVMVMYAGKVMEYGTLAQVIDHPKHPYTKALLKSIPNGSQRKTHLHVIKGMVPSLANRPSGCAFHPRCAEATEKCLQHCPALCDVGDHHQVRCFLYTDLVEEDDE